MYHDVALIIDPIKTNPRRFATSRAALNPIFSDLRLRSCTTLQIGWDLGGRGWGLRGGRGVKEEKEGAYTRMHLR